jgi:glucosyl-dolichyl phosphate glucuronosyltransferase
MSAQPMLSVIICTYNRPTLIAKCLDHVIVQKGCEPNDYEVIVVDNCPSASVADVVAREAEKGAVAVRYVLEQKVGLSHARNRGIQEAHAELIGFMDDDAFATPGWVAAVLAAFQRYPECDALGGKLIGDWEEPRPTWLHDELLSMLGETRYGEVSRILAADEWPFGGNMAFRRHVFEQVGDFSTRLGFSRNGLLGLEEVDLAYRMRQTNQIIRYVPEMMLYHHIPADKLRRSYFTHRIYWSGRSLAVWHGMRGGRISQFSQSFLRTFGGIPRSLLAWIEASLRRNTRDQFLAVCLAHKSLGYIQESLDELARPPRQPGLR